MRLGNASAALIMTIGAAMSVPPGYAFAKPADFADLKAKGLAVDDPNVKNPGNADEVAVALTPSGKTEYDARVKRQNKAESTPRAPVDPSSFQRARITTIPDKPGRGGARTSMYPFDDLAAPDDSGFDSFLILPTEARPEPAKTLLSTVSGATKRWKKAAEADSTGNTVARVFVLIPEPIEGGKVAARVARKV